MPRRVNRDKFEDYFYEQFDLQYVESEGDDTRIDFDSETSIWLRDGLSVEGCLPKNMKLKVNSIISKLKLENCIEYI